MAAMACDKDEPPKVYGFNPERKGVKVGDDFDAMHYLFPSPEHYLIRWKDGKEEKVYSRDIKKMHLRYMLILTICIPEKEKYEIVDMCDDLNGTFSELAKDYKDFQVVLVVRMTPKSLNHVDKQLVAKAAFTRFFSAFSPLFLVVPVSDCVRSLRLFKLSGSPVYGSPGCIISHLKKQQVLNISFSSIRSIGVDLYPFTFDKLLKPLTGRMLHGMVPLSTFLHCETSTVLDCLSHGKGPCGGKKIVSSLTNKVVFLYYLCDGAFLNELCNLYEQCRQEAHKFELIVIRAKSYHVRNQPMSSTLESQVESLIEELKKSNNCCGWPSLPYSDRMSRRMHSLDYRCQDKLVVVGPNSKYVDLHGKEVFLEYGIEAYPFSKEVVWDSQVKRLRGIRLHEWLEGCGIGILVKRPDDGGLDIQTLTVSDLPDKDFLVWFGFTLPNWDASDWEGCLPKWVEEMKLASKRDLEVIIVCLGDVVTVDGGGTSSTVFLQYWHKTGWYLPFPLTNSNNQKLLCLLIGRLPESVNCLAAFGPNGQLLRLGMERSLQHESATATFPEVDELKEDVRYILSSQLTSDVWCQAFKDYDEKREIPPLQPFPK